MSASSWPSCGAKVAELELEREMLEKAAISSARETAGVPAGKWRGVFLQAVSLLLLLSQHRLPGVRAAGSGRR